jgi:hypothetical protein
MHPMTASSNRRSDVTGPRRGFIGGPRRPVSDRERRLYAAGVAALALDAIAVALRGPPAALLAVGALAALALFIQPRLARRSRVLWSGALGLLTAWPIGVSDGLRVVTAGPEWSQASGVAGVLGGFALIASAAVARHGPRAQPRWGRLGWAAFAASVASFVWLPLGVALITTHAERLPASQAVLDRPHGDARTTVPGGGEDAVWYAPAHVRTIGL